MPDETRAPQPLVTAVDNAVPLTDAEADPLLRALYDRLPHGYGFDGQHLLRVISSGRARPLCGPVLVRAQARNAAGAGWCADIAFRSRDGVWQSSIVPMRDLLSAPARVVSSMIDRGFELLGRPKDVCDCLLAMPVDHVGQAIEWTGWADDRFAVFACPSGEIVTRTGAQSPFLFSGKPRVMEPLIARGQRAQAAQTWITAIRACEAPEAVMIGLCAAFAPVVLPVRGDPSFLLHLDGNEAAGRISRTVAAGLWGPPSQLTLGWAEPLARILTAMDDARDGLLIFSGYEARHARKLPAVAEALAARDAAGPNRMVILSTGQMPIHPSGPRAQVGLDLRNVVDIDARVWDAEAVDEITEAALTRAGVFGPQAVQSAIDWNLSARATFLGICTEEILETLTHADVGPVDVETDRISRVFGALHGTAAVLELQKMVPGLTRSTALFQRLFREWVARNRGVLSASERVLLGRTATAIRDLLRDGALIPLDTAEPVVPLSEVGWFDAEAVYLSVATVTSIALNGGVSMDKLTDLLLSRNFLQHQQERGNQWRLPGRVPGRPRAYKILRAEILRYAAASAAPDDRARGG